MFAIAEPIALAPNGCNGTQELMARGGKKRRPYVLVATGLIILVTLAGVFAAIGQDLKGRGIVALLFAGASAWLLSTAPRALASGSIAPFMSERFDTVFVRSKRPALFWGSMAWNILWAGTFGLLAGGALGDAKKDQVADRCFNPRGSASAREAVAACDQLIAGWSPRDWYDVADLLAARGVAHHQLRDPIRAIVDYSAAIRMDQQDAVPRYNRGVLHQQAGDLHRALADYSAAIGLEPAAPGAYLRRAEIFDALGDPARAAADRAWVAGLPPQP
jgi:tetratricopeptide (TPR) repeat protein